MSFITLLDSQLKRHTDPLYWLDSYRQATHSVQWTSWWKKLGIKERQRDSTEPGVSSGGLNTNPVEIPPHCFSKHEGVAWSSVCACVYILKKEFYRASVVILKSINKRMAQKMRVQCGKVYEQGLKTLIKVEEIFLGVKCYSTLCVCKYECWFLVLKWEYWWKFKTSLSFCLSSSSLALALIWYGGMCGG